MKIYLASSFSLVSKVETVSEALEEIGHEITVKWWSREYEIPGEGKVITSDLKKRFNPLDPDLFYAQPETEKSYLADLAGIEEADILILIAPNIASRSALVGGNIELGYALACGLFCFSLGALMNSAMYHGVKRLSSFQELIEVLGDPRARIELKDP